MTKLSDVLEHYDITIGIECHVQLSTKTKLFSGADNDARDKDPNTTVSPICFGFPGVLPVLNEKAVELAVRAGLAMNATIPRLSRFERKHYFYPDLPLGYQITQLAEPVIVGGHVEVPQLEGEPKTVRIHHAHLESDAGKLTHPGAGSYSLVDLNRAGTPLIEIVSEADIHSPAEARAYAQELYLLMVYAGVTHGDLYQGNMRFDVNLSLSKKGDKTLGTRTETKNLNSFRSVEKAAEYEAIRQAEVLDKGDLVKQETRGWNDAKQKTFSQRSKEDAHDYRYFPDADIPPVIIEPDQVEQISSELPVLPPTYRTSWGELKLNQSVVNALLAAPVFAQLVSAVQSDHSPAAATRVANWCASAVDIDEPIKSIASASQSFAELADMVEKNELNSTNAKEIFNQLLREDISPRKAAEEKGVLQTNDESALEAIVDAVLADPGSEKAIADIRGGNERAIGYLVGQAMKQSHGAGNPAVFQQMFRSKIN
jgi:aspartyl-tRNA(Asn)/glutamyl-tRNA(Gln) amidotransferase subunit B